MPSKWNTPINNGPVYSMYGLFSVSIVFRLAVYCIKSLDISEMKQNRFPEECYGLGIHIGGRLPFYVVLLMWTFFKQA